MASRLPLHQLREPVMAYQALAVPQEGAVAAVAELEHQQRSREEEVPAAAAAAAVVAEEVAGPLLPSILLLPQCFP